MIPVTTSALSGIVALCIAYGALSFLFLVVLAIHILYIANSESASRRIRHAMFMAISVVQFLLTTAYLVVAVMRAFAAFVDIGASDEATLFLSSVNTWYIPSRTALWIAAALITDGVLVFRLWVLSQDFQIGRFSIRPPAIVPGLLCLASLAMGGSVIHSTLHVSLTSTYASEVYNRALAYLALSFAQNFLASFCIVYRLYSIWSGVKKYALNGSTMKVILWIAASGSIYSATSFSLLCAYATKSNLSAILQDFIVPITTLSSYLIVLQTALNNPSMVARVLGTGGQVMSHHTTRDLPRPRSMELVRIQIKTELEQEADQGSTVSKEPYSKYATEDGSEMYA